MAILLRRGLIFQGVTEKRISLHTYIITQLVKKIYFIYLWFHYVYSPKCLSEKAGASRFCPYYCRLSLNWKRVLIVWIQDQAENCVPLSLITIQARFLGFWHCEEMVTDQRIKRKIIADKIRFTHFKGRCALYTVGVQGQAVSADEMAAQESRKHFMLWWQWVTKTLIFNPYVCQRGKVNRAAK